MPAFSPMSSSGAHLAAREDRISVRGPAGPAGRAAKARWPAAAALAWLVLWLAACTAPLATGTGPHPSTGFGRLPTPRLGPPDESITALPGQALPYFGPARLTVLAKVPALPARLPVWRFAVPPAHQLELLASAHQGQAIVPAATNYREPIIFINRPAPMPQGTSPAPDVAQPVADEFLRQQGLTPTWPYQASVIPYGPLAVVRYTRQFAVPAYGGAGQVDAHGTATGASVAVASNRSVFQATIPAPIALSEQAYRTASAASLAGTITTASPPAAQGSGPTPEVLLTEVHLVYMAVAAGPVGYFEPALLFTGEFAGGSSRFQKRVLVPALDASQLTGR